MKEESFFDFSWFSFEYADSAVLWILLLVPIIFYFDYNRIKAPHSQVNYSTTLFIQKNKITNALPWILVIVKLLAITFFILALARPQLINEGNLIKREVESIDIIIALDVSESMLAEDFSPNRLEAAKEVGMKFVKDRPQDRIGLVVYEGEAFTQCPLTNDHSALTEKFKEVNTGYMEPGTAIGMGLATAVNRLKDSKAKSKVIILLSDGENNRGNIDPITAAELAKEFGIRVYSIGVGKNGLANFPVRDPFGGIMRMPMEVHIDEVALKEIAKITQGQYFRAENKKGLEKIYKEIDELEKTKVKINEFKLDPPDKFHSFLFFGILSFLLHLLLKQSLLRAIND